MKGRTTHSEFVTTSLTIFNHRFHSEINLEKVVSIHKCTSILSHWFELSLIDFVALTPFSMLL